MEANIIVQERDHNDVFAERDNSSSIASGLSLLCFFSLQIVHLSPQFRLFILPTAATLRYVRESEEIRLAMRPLELIKRVKEIQQEVYAKPETVKEKDTKQTVAGDLSKRLKDLHSVNDATSFKALEEWRKRKMERARLRELEKNGTLASQA
ncbi:hypothetical protein PRUPE_1G050700 [Prunus persica]|uniref:Uncharacterized protein n=1 Tax=Prunus persica TaxID=3760 RepID=M5XHA2_PRUPE|nr:hypothetical protein PRUPE_1G050700 [Prunus persica]